jgi:hypothetical protein
MIVPVTFALLLALASNTSHASTYSFESGWDGFVNTGPKQFF